MEYVLLGKVSHVDKVSLKQTTYVFIYSRLQIITQNTTTITT